MADKTTFVKFDRNIMRWGWYKDVKTFKLFFHLVMIANISECKFENVVVKRGQVVRSYNSLSKETGLSIKEVRTALNHLIGTQEVAQSSHSKFSVFTILNYDFYQAVGTNMGTQWASKGQTVGTQGATIKERKNIKNNKEEREEGSLPQLSDVESYVSDNNYSFEAKRFFDYYNATDWKIGNTPITNWKAKADSWQSSERPSKTTSNKIDIKPSYDINDLDQKALFGKIEI